MSRARDRYQRLTVAALFVGILFALPAGLAIAQDEDAGARIIHAAHGAGPIDVYVDGSVAIEALDYTEATGYISVPAGDHTLQLVAVGNDPASALVEVEVALAPGTPHTLVVFGMAESVDTVVIVDDHSPPATGMARLSLVNATSDATTITLRVGDDDSLVGDVPGADASEYFELEPGTLDLSILAAGTGEAIATVTGFSIEAGSTYSVVAMGVGGDYQVAGFLDYPQADSPSPEATPTAVATTPAAAENTATPGTSTPDAGGDPTPAVQPTATQPVATATVIPDLPSTGAGGTSQHGGSALTLLLGGLVVVLALAGLGVWRLRGILPGGRG